MDEALDAIVELDEDTEGRDAADDAREFLADELRHVLDLLHVRRLALCLDGDAFALRSVVRNLRQHRAQLRLALCRDAARRKRLAQQTVHDEVRIAANRRGEVRVVASGQAEVAEAHVAVACLLHRAQRHRADDALFRLALDLLEHLLDVHRLDVSRLRLMNEESEGTEQVVEALDLLVRRLFMHAVHERLMLRVHVTSHRLIRDQHALFDDGLRQRALALNEGDRMSFVIEFDLDLRHVEVNRAAAMALGLEDVAQRFERLEHLADVLVVRDERLRLVDEHLVDDIVGQAAVNVDDRRDDLVTRDFALRRDLHLTGHREAVNAGVEAADAVAELLRQHRDDAVHEVDARAALARLAVERLAFAHVPADIGDVDAEEEGAVRIAARKDAVIEILRVLTVDRDDWQVAAVAAPSVLLRCRLLLYVIGCFLHVLRERLREVILAHDGEDVDARVADLAEYLDDLALCIAAAVRPLRDLDDDLAARLRAVERLLRHEDILAELRVVRRHEAERLAALERADDFLVRALEDADDLALARTAFFLCRRHACDDAVAMHGRIEVRPRHEDIRLLFRLAHIRDDEAEALGRHREAADDEVHAARDAVEVAAVLDDCALFLQFLERRIELHELFLRQLHPFRQVLSQQRTVCLLVHIR